MDLNLSQSSCEIITEIKNLEVCSETENFSDQFSDITKKVDELNVELESNKESSKEFSSASESESNDSSSSSTDNDAPVKRKRKRKRKRRKKNTVAAYSPPEPFTARYKRIKMMQPAVLPKLHIRFDELGAPDVETSEYTMKPKIVRCLAKNLLIHENIRDCKTSAPAENLIQDLCIRQEEFVVSLKPRIIKAIIIT